MPDVGITDISCQVPGPPIGLEAFVGREPTALDRSPLLRPPELRHHVAPDDRAADLVVAAAQPLFERQGVEPAEVVDVLITNVLLPDIPITGCGAEVAARLGCRPEWVIDLHNGGCASFPYMLRLASVLMQAGRGRGALLCNVQNTAGQVFSQPSVRDRQHAIAAGDGCAVALLEPGAPSPLVGTAVRHDPAAAADMGLGIPGGRKYWQAGNGDIDIAFASENTHAIVKRGNKSVPAVVRDLCLELGVETSEIDVLITNQPNRMFLRNWRDALGVPAERHLDTFDRYGNLYGAGAPLTLAEAHRASSIKAGSLVVIAGFAHAGDFAAAAALRWMSRAPARPRDTAGLAGAAA